MDVINNINNFSIQEINNTPNTNDSRILSDKISNKDINGRITEIPLLNVPVNENDEINRSSSIKKYSTNSNGYINKISFEVKLSATNRISTVFFIYNLIEFIK